LAIWLSILAGPKIGSIRGPSDSYDKVQFEFNHRKNIVLCWKSSKKKMPHTKQWDLLLTLYCHNARHFFLCACGFEKYPILMGENARLFLVECRKTDRLKLKLTDSSVIIYTEDLSYMIRCIGFIRYKLYYCTMKYSLPPNRYRPNRKFFKSLRFFFWKYYRNDWW